MATIDLDKLKAATSADPMDVLLKWELVIRLGGRDYRVRPPRMLDMAKLAAVDGGQVHELPAALAELFEDPRPDLAALEIEDLVAVAAAIVSHTKEHVRKNSQTLVARIGRGQGR